jgi:hypothetical protein
MITFNRLDNKSCIYIYISTNNIATGIVRGSQVHFQSTKNMLSIHPSRPAHQLKIGFRPNHARNVFFFITYTETFSS